MLGLSKQKGKLALDLRFVGATSVTPTGERLLPGKVSYLIGSNPARWRRNLSTYGQVVYRKVWPGIDVVFKGDGRRLVYEFLLRRHARVADIGLMYQGARGLAIGSRGDLGIRTALGVLRDTRPLSYQLIGGRRVFLRSRFVLRRAGSVGFSVAGYNPRHPLVIDPGLVYSTYLGGSSPDQPFGIAVDGSGSAYVAGYTQSADFPTTAGAVQTASAGGQDAFVTKLNASGTAALYSTYLGGSSGDLAGAVAVDAGGDAYIAGTTGSANFPTTAGAFKTTYGGNVTAFVTKLNASGSALLYSTYLGGSGGDQAVGIAADGAGDAFVTGHTNSIDYPTTPGAPGTTATSGGDAFVAKLNPAGSALVYSTLLGGNSIDTGRSIAVDSTGDAYVGGDTLSSDYPTTTGAFQTTFGGGQDAFVTKLNATGTAPLLYSTYLGGAGTEVGEGIAIDAAGNAYLTGATSSANFPVTAGAFQTTYGGGQDAFVTKLNAAGSSALYSTYLGGSNVDQTFGIAVDSVGDALVTGATGSSGFPTTSTAYNSTYNGGIDAFVTKLKAAGDGLLYSSFLGTSGFDVAEAIAVDSSGNFAYVTGVTNSAAFPTTAGAFQSSYHGGSQDGFVTDIGVFGPPASLALTPKTATDTVGDSHCVTATVHDALGNPVPGVTVRFSVAAAIATHGSPSSGSDTTNSSGQASFCFSAELPGTNTLQAYADTNNNTTKDGGEPADSATKTWTLPASTAPCSVTLGGGITADNGDKSTFGGNATAASGGATKGQQQYMDKGPALKINVLSTSVDAVVCSADGKQASIFGRAKINGSGSYNFKIDVQDLGEPGVGFDTYRILLSSGYDSGAHTLTNGNIQIRLS